MLTVVRSRFQNHRLPLCMTRSHLFHSHLQPPHSACLSLPPGSPVRQVCVAGETVLNNAQLWSGHCSAQNLSWLLTGHSL